MTDGPQKPADDAETRPPLRRRIVARWDRLGPVGRAAVAVGAMAVLAGGIAVLARARSSAPDTDVDDFEAWADELALEPGEYVFDCLECDGEGSIQVGQEDDEAPDGYSLVWDTCEDCHGEGTMSYDENEAAEAIDCGRIPLKRP
ncbi:hypothetical protein PV396_33585 [Streptomyces sp. ME02-8801-2C]|uniref:hypothetical protein n=1 Tax=Streptomyces sp. ME02-8801-2C TaxID=3028680 RepID=UPI0029AD867C|nr:hypothetical protein [Streptomyces sp. ME02-8801-2C]MDX3456825.1 hypothetical protein [Streptomyces sp. ME02-8801-2C]